MAPRRAPRLIASMASIAAVLAPALVIGAARAESVVTPVADAAAASSNSAWLAGRLDRGTFPNPLNPDLPDHGLMIDAVYAMYASGDGKLATPIIDRLDDDQEARRFFTYYGFGEGQDWLQNEGLDDRVGGAAAKVLVAAETAGRNPRAFGGYDMVKETQNVIVHPDDVAPGGRFAQGSTVNPLFTIGAEEVGRVVDFGPTTSYNNANTFGQTLAVIGLAGAAANDQSAIDKLTWQQCSEGYFRVFYSYHPTTNRLETCDEGKKTGFSAPDRDSTGLALSALAAARQAGAKGLDEPIRRTVDWLESEQTPGGGWGGGVSTEAPNSNSTGLIVQGLADVGADPDVIAQGAAYLRAAQVTPADADTAMKNDTGAIAYTPGEYQQSKTDGIVGLDTWVRAGAQASLGLSRASFWQLVTRTVPTPGPDPTPTSTSTSTSSPTSTSTSSPTAGPTRPPQPTVTVTKTSSTRVPVVVRVPVYRPSPAGPATGRPATRPRSWPPGRNSNTAARSSRATPTPLPPTRAPNGRTPTAGPSQPGSSRWLVPGSVAPSGRLARFLAGSLVNGDHVETVTGGQWFVDYDATADAVLALRSLNEQPATVARASRFLLAPAAVKAYGFGAPYETSSAAYAEPLAKLILIGQMSQRDGSAPKQTPAQVAAMRASLIALQGSDGTFDDVGTFADRTDGVERHALATLALTATNDAVGSGRGVEALLARQCVDGGFARDLTKRPCSTGDPLATGWAAQALNTKTQSLPAAAVSAPLASAVIDPAVSNAVPPATWAGKRLEGVRRVMVALQAQTSADGLVLDSAGKTDVRASAVVAAGQQAVGLDASSTARALGSRLLSDGGLPASGRKTSDFTTSLTAAEGVAGGSWLTQSASPVTPAAFALGASGPAVAPAATASSATDPWWQRPWAFAIWLLLAAAIGALGYAGIRRLKPIVVTRHTAKSTTPNEGDPS